MSTTGQLLNQKNFKNKLANKKLNISWNNTSLEPTFAPVYLGVIISYMIKNKG
jgi:hypothetical protein